MTQHDMIIADDDGAAVRADINSGLQALASTSKGATAPSTIYTGQPWIEDDSPSSTVWTEKVYDGTDSIPKGLIDTTNNRYLPAIPIQPGGRATLTSSTPVTTSDVTAATTVYYTPHLNDLVPIYSTFFAPFVFSELSLALDSNSGHTGYHQSGKNFDLFVFNDAGTIRLGTGPAWSSDTSRGTGAGTTELERKNGVWTNKVSMTTRFGSSSGNTVSVAANQGTYVGTMRCTADGQTQDSEAKRFLWNTYHRKVRSMAVLEATNSWNYSTASFQQVNNSSANQLDFVVGLAEDAVVARARGLALSSGATVCTVRTGIGLDSTSTNSARLISQNQCTSSLTASTSAEYCGYPGLGRHFLAALEYGAGVDTQTWFGDNNSPSNLQTGITGEVWA